MKYLLKVWNAQLNVWNLKLYVFEILVWYAHMFKRTYQIHILYISPRITIYIFLMFYFYGGCRLGEFDTSVRLQLLIIATTTQVSIISALELFAQSTAYFWIVAAAYSPVLSFQLEKKALHCSFVWRQHMTVKDAVKAKMRHNPICW